SSSHASEVSRECCSPCSASEDHRAAAPYTCRLSEGRAHQTPGTRPIPGTLHRRRFVPRFHYELLICGVRGHELVGVRGGVVPPEAALVVGERDGLGWHRCVRCDAWLPLALPDPPSMEHVPARGEIELPLRGKALRDKIVLRVIAIDRALHFVVLALLAVAIFAFAKHETQLRDAFYRALGDVGGRETGTPASPPSALLPQL